MSGRFSTYVRLVSAMSLLMILLGMAGSPTSAQDPCAPNENNEVADGCTLSAGTLAIWEGVADGSTWIYVGYVPDKGFTVDRANGFNAWSGYDSFEQARNSACDSVVNPRLVKDGFTVYINDVSYTGDLDACKAIAAYGNDPNGGNTGGNDSGSTTIVSNDGGNTEPASTGSGDDNLDSLTVGSNNDSSTTTSEERPMVTDPGIYRANEFAQTGVECRAAESAALVTGETSTLNGTIFGQEASTSLPEGADVIAGGKAIPPGVCINSGLIVVRINHFGVGGQENVRAIQVGDGLVVYCGKRGKLAFDCWENYVSVDDATLAACEQAVGDQYTVNVPGAFNYRFSSITFTIGENTYKVTPDTVCQ